MSKTSPTVIRLSVTDEVRRALNTAKKRYPTLTDPEILKLGLSKIVIGNDTTTISTTEKDEIRRSASYAIGGDYLQDLEEDLYTPNNGKRVHF